MKSRWIFFGILPIAVFSLAFALSPGNLKASEVEIETLVLHFQPNDVFAPHSVGIKKGWLPARH
jgi:hypothetical protein